MLAKDLIRQMLNPDFKLRISTVEIGQHTWMQGESTSKGVGSMQFDSVDYNEVAAADKLNMNSKVNAEYAEPAPKRAATNGNKRKDH